MWTFQSKAGYLEDVLIHRSEWNSKRLNPGWVWTWQMTSRNAEPVSSFTPTYHGHEWHRNLGLLKMHSSFSVFGFGCDYTTTKKKKRVVELVEFMTDFDTERLNYTHNLKYAPWQIFGLSRLFRCLVINNVLISGDILNGVNCRVCN